MSRPAARSNASVLTAETRRHGEAAAERVLQLAADLVPAEAGEPDVEDDERRSLHRRGEDVLARREPERRVARSLEQAPDELPQVRVVFDDEDLDR